MPIKFPNWFRIFWWVLVSSIVTYFLWKRYPDLITGHSAPVDVFIFLIWIGLLLIPVFQEVSFFGISLKQQIKEARAELKEQIQSLKAEIHNNVDVRSQVSQTVYASPPDSSLPDLEQRVKRAVTQALASHPRSPTPQLSEIKVPDDTSYLFSVRFAIEEQLRRIFSRRFPDTEQRRPIPVFRLTESLVQNEILPPDLGSVIRDVYAVCSPAIHGERVTSAKVAFVRDVAPELIATLKSIDAGI